MERKVKAKVKEVSRVTKIGIVSRRDTGTITIQDSSGPSGATGGQEGKVEKDSKEEKVEKGKVITEERE